MSLDGFDKEILRELEQDARISYRKISEKINISVGTVHNRIARLKEHGIIQGYLLSLNEQKLDYKLKVVISLSIKGTKLHDTLKKISKYRQVTNVYSISGNASAILICRFRNLDEFRSFSNQLHKIEAINQLETNIIIDVIKEDPHHLLSSEPVE